MKQPSLLDTDTLSEFLKRKNAQVNAHAAEYLNDQQQFAISAMTRYEVLRWLKEKNATAQIKRFATFCQHSLVFAISDDVLDRATDLWTEGRRGGHPHRDADLIIAATALQHNRVLVTGNTSDFDWIPGLTLENWTQP